MHGCWCWRLLLELLIFPFCCCCCFDLSSTYNHNKIKGIPNAKNTPIVRIGTRKTNKNIPKHNVAMPRAESQRVVRLAICRTQYLSDIWHFFTLFSFFIFCKVFIFCYITTLLICCQSFSFSS